MGIGGIITSFFVISGMYKAAEQAGKSGFLWGGVALLLIVVFEMGFDVHRLLSALISGFICFICFTVYRVATEN